MSRIPQAEILINLKVAVDTVGTNVLRFTSNGTDTHSVRSSLAMMMYLSKEQIYTIMLVGCWSSDAFLAYIKKQVKEYTRGVSSGMLRHDTFYNTPLAITQAT